MWTMSISAMLFKSSTDICGEVPMPADAKLSWPGRCLAYAISSATDFTVGEGFGGHLDAYHLAGARAVVHDELLAERCGELLREGARDDVGAAACRGGHDEAHRLRRISGLRRRSGADQGRQEKGRGQKQIRFDHGSSIFLVSTTRLHFSISAWTRRPISSGLLALGVPPHSAKRRAISGSATTRLTSRLIRSAIAPGMPGGPAMPRKELAS